MKKLVICNQKMFLSYDETKILKDQMDDIDFSNVDLVVCPNFLNMDVFSGYNLGAQDCHYEERGAYTGSVSPYDLKLRGVSYCLTGHSERRCYDSNKDINLKVKAILRNMMTPVICIGETKIDRELMRISEVLKKELTSAVSGIKLDSADEIVIAYEPVWAIGGDKALKKEEIEDTFKYIRKILEENNITNYKLIYGGSITPSNIKSILSDNIDGYLLGSSSASFDELSSIIKCIK